MRQCARLTISYRPTSKKSRNSFTTILCSLHLMGSRRELAHWPQISRASCVGRLSMAFVKMTVSSRRLKLSARECFVLMCYSTWSNSSRYSRRLRAKMRMGWSSFNPSRKSQPITNTMQSTKHSNRPSERLLKCMVRWKTPQPMVICRQ